MPPVQTPFVQVPLQGWLHPPQCCGLVVMSTHMAGEPHIIWFWPQVQAPPVHVAPAGQGVQPPQCKAVPPVGGTHAPSVHWISPVGQSPQPPLVQP